MKKIIFLLSIFSLIFVFSPKEEIIIPNNAIRFRIIANNNNDVDQIQKQAITNELKNALSSLLRNVKNVNDAHRIIQNNLDNLNDIMSTYDIEYKINYGENYFPAKKYNNIIYQAGNYQSLVITLGDGLGDNFWCVLYPPLCLLENETDTNDIKYQFYVKKILDSF